MSVWARFIAPFVASAASAQGGALCPPAPARTRRKGAHKGRPYRVVVVCFGWVLRSCLQHKQVMDGVSCWYVVGATPCGCPELADLRSEAILPSVDRRRALAAFQQFFRFALNPDWLPIVFAPSSLVLTRSTACASVGLEIALGSAHCKSSISRMRAMRCRVASLNCGVVITVSMYVLPAQ